MPAASLAAFRQVYSNNEPSRRTANTTKPSHMKNQSHSNLIVRPILALTLALFIWAPVQAQSTAPAEGKMMMDGKMKEPHQPMTKPQQAMMQHHHAMMADMKKQDAQLSAQLAEMNSAPQDKKLDLMAAIVTRMVEQRTAMNARMGMMQGEMMQCPMQEMTPDANTPPQKPMMNGMGMKGKMGPAKK